ncbi:MAG: motility protein A [Butyrivibrio sp.]|nr:motility protein A [Butyrivibrio sp.]
MDLASLIGVVMGLVVMLIGIATSGGIQTIGNFIDVPSLLVTFGGAFMATLATVTLPEFINGLKSFTLIMKLPPYDTGALIKQIVDLSNTARKEGLLALEEAAHGIEEPLLQKGLLLIVDGTEPELVKGIMQAEIDAMNDRHMSIAGFWETLGAMGPAWGMIGTLIGLVNMLQNLSDSASLGPSMATALITTFYGSLLANWICTPCNAKLKVQNSMEYAYKSLMIEGLLSIQAGENPRVTEEKLKAFMAPADRAAYEAANGDGSGGGE